MEINTDCYSSDEWILKMFEGYFDPCPLNDNPEIDALKIDWKDKTFVNPPYSHPLPFVRKAIEESRKGKLIVMLLKMDTSTNWFKELKEADAEFLWINGRLHYNGLHHTYKGNVPLSFPSMFVILKPIIKQELKQKLGEMK
jgi:hypothetical protein